MLWDLFKRGWKATKCLIGVTSKTIPSTPNPLLTSPWGSGEFNPPWGSGVRF